ncbi:acyl-[acyl-carrier-protein]--UDP-N-acetylglucosamine O-acyltransferase, partial [Leptospira borgpetersenii serovar Balcanica]|nr:acyl-[acyl-carrier-protein]--UDP-N-acetylglucosamine O-acyltransferase [Leptospira borgpetersenii serovar Balcanica]
MTQIHRTAIVSSTAEIHDSVVIGPYCIVGDNVTIDAGTKLLRHVVITKNTR